jgi:hypothetical protein
MDLQFRSNGEPALELKLSRGEVPLFRALLQRASFIDTRPELQGAVFDLIEQLLARLPEDDAPPPRRGE